MHIAPYRTPPLPEGQGLFLGAFAVWAAAGSPKGAWYMRIHIHQICIIYGTYQTYMLYFTYATYISEQTYQYDVHM